MNAAVQLYSLRDLDRPLPDLLDLVAETPLGGVELAGLGDASHEPLAAALERTGLEAVAAHVPLATLETDPASVTGAYRRLGCGTLVVPWLDPEAFATEAAVDRVAARLSTVTRGLDDIDLAYHNHDQEFVALTDEDAYDRLVGALEGVSLELDVGWATAAGRDPVAVLERYASSIDLVHLKDVDGDRPCALGRGDVPLEACVDAARAAGVEWVIYEHDDPADPLAALRRDADTLVSLLE
ncbi:sugar phosphate isomerase/epimerase family protein [Natrononativus amylolyticus]|uniref:sugar phosphate isomerase/epimerase family protein n=1 Tax=Natrononativus amylolyticus TaxID=2963434 RepID=UPI0020CCF798|nr:sugar phosphate isomerase/epimerase [Natrononativus amylolyticus]